MGRMRFEGTVPVYRSTFQIVGGDLTGSTWDFGSHELCLRMSTPNSAVVVCGAQQGDPWVVCEGVGDPPEPIDQVPPGWDEVMEVSLNTTHPPILLESSASFPLFDSQPLTTHVGWTRIRVQAKGRRDARAGDQLSPEFYSITAWPEQAEREPLVLSTESGLCGYRSSGTKGDSLRRGAGEG